MKCKKLWLYLGVISVFVCDFSYFAYGVYTPGGKPHVRGQIVMPGTTIYWNYSNESY
jgi:hypothetical protein